METEEAELAESAESAESMLAQAKEELRRFVASKKGLMVQNKQKWSAFPLPCCVFWAAAPVGDEVL